MRRPDELPDPAFSDDDLNTAVVETIGHMGHQGDAQTLPASYGPPEMSEDHNSAAIWKNYGGSS